MEAHKTGKNDAEILADSVAHKPLAERVVHKHWKVREIAYCHLAEAFDSAADDDKLFDEYARSMAKIARDPQQAAQMTGFSAISKFAENAPIPLVRSTAKDVGKALAEKGLNGRPINRTRASETLVAMVGAECGHVIIDVFANTGFKNKSAKVVAGSAKTICDALTTYGKSHIPIKEVCKHIPKLLNDKNKEVRAAGKQLAVLLNYWTKQPAQTLIPGVKEVITKELEPLFAENAKKSKPKATKLTRSKLKRIRKGEDEVDDESESEDESEEEEEEDLDLGIDIWERVQSMKVAVEFDQNGKPTAYEQWLPAFKSDKWNYHKAAIDAVIETIGESRIAAGAQANIVPRLRDFLKKSKMAVVIASCARLVTALILGLRKDFPRSLARECTIYLIQRLKESSKIVAGPVATALDTLHLKKCVKVFDFRSDIETASKIKSPKARVNLLRWLGRCISKGMPSADIKGEALQFFGQLFLKETSDRSTEVRDAALHAISALQVLAGEKSSAKYVDKLDKQRQAKVASGAAKIREMRKAEKAGAGAEGKPETEASSAKKTAKSPKAGKTGKSSKSTKSSSKSAGSSSSAKKPKPIPVYVSDDEAESPIDSDAALEAAAQKYPEFDAEQWSHKSAKARAACVKLVNKAIEEREGFDNDEANLLLSLVSREPGLQDTSFMVVKEKLELLGSLAAKSRNPLPRKTLLKVLLPAIEKLGDIKCAKAAEKVLVSLAEATSARFFFQSLSSAARETINGRAQIGIVKFAVKVVDDFGIPAVKAEDVAGLVVAMSAKKGSAALGKAIITLACQTSIRTPGSFRDLLVSANLDNDNLEAFDSEVAKYQNAPDAPTRKKRHFGPPLSEAPVEENEDLVSEDETEVAGSPDVSSNESDSSPDGKSTPPPTRDMAPRRREPPKTPVRVNIADKFIAGSSVITKLQSKDWQLRSRGLIELDSIVEEANSFIEGNVGRTIFPLLKKRMTDSNVNVAAVAYAVAGRMVTAMGPEAALHIKIVMPTILEKGCTDIKKNVRSAAMQSVNIWYEAVGMVVLLPYLHHPFKVKPDKQGKIRKDFLEWIIPRITGQIGDFVPLENELQPLVEPCVTCLQDNITEVRQLAEVLLQPIVANMGFAAVDAKIPEKKSIRLQLGPVLKKYMPGNVDVPPSDAAVPKTPVSRFSARKTPRVTSTRAPKRPQSLMLTPKTPIAGPGRMFAEGTAPVSSRRPRSVNVTKYASPLIPIEEDEAHILVGNKGHSERCQQYMLKRRRLVEEATAAEGPDGFASLVVEEPEDLWADLKDCVSPSLYSLLTAPANRFHSHVDAMSAIKSFMSDDPETTVSVTDVILRWAAFRIEDGRTPPTVLSLIAEFIVSICEVLLSSGVKLTEYEASAVVPAIVGKCGSNREAVRKSMLACLLSIGDVVPEDIMLVFLSSSLRRPIGDRACEEVAAEICQLIDRKCASGAGLPIGVLPVVAKVTYGDDEAAGRAAATCISRAHHHFGDDLWGLLGPLTDSQARLIEERLAQANAAQQVEPTTPMGSPPAAQYGVSASPAVPTLGDIRMSDFRLSVAPEPSSTVISTIKDVMNSATPAKTRPAFGLRGAVEQTPAFPQRRVPTSPKTPDPVDTVVYVLEQLQSEDRNAQLDGLSVLYSDLQLSDSKLRKRPSDVMPNLSRCFSEALSRIEGSQGNDDDPLILKRFLNAIMAFAREPEVIVLLDQFGMHKLLSDLLYAMVPDEVQRIDDWKQVRRGVNLVLLKILEACNQNVLFTSLINVLSESIATSSGTHDASLKARISSKCTFCINSIAKATQKGFSECNIDVLLSDMHQFLVTNPVRPQENAVSEEQTIAIRLLKTIVDKLVGEVGFKIRVNLKTIENGAPSQLARYIEMKLSDGTITLPDADEDAASEAPSENGADIGSAAGMGEVDVPNDGDPGTTERLRPFSLRAKYGLPPRAMAPAVGASRPPKLQGSGQVYLKRLKEIQERYGLQQSNANAAAGSSPEGAGSAGAGGSTGVNRAVGTREGAGSSRATSPADEETRNRAAALRERMARIRAGKAALG